jgi:phosphatidylethanolamine/phosphatidyl-N-methylethanolamine N-methyltransferase
VADFVTGNSHWLDGDPERLALLGLMIVAFALATAFGATRRYSLLRRRMAPIAHEGALSSMSTSESLDSEAQVRDERRDERSKLHRKASIVSRRFRKSRRIKDNLLFLSSFAAAPLKVGSVTPSSRALGRAMAAALPDEYSVCVELGGGTGSLTSALLAAGVPSQRLIVIERDHKLVTHLRKRFPKVQVVEGDAQHLRRILAEAGVDHVDAVISGLPLRSLPGSVRRNIMSEVFSALGKGGVLVQFTYWGEPPVPDDIVRRNGVDGEMIKRVWRNMPPANVWRYERQTDSVN